MFHPTWCDVAMSTSSRRFETLRAPGRGRIQEEAGVVRIASGLHGPEFNPVFITSPRADLAQVIEASKSFMASANVSDWRLVAFDATISKVEGPAISAGLHSGRLMPGMALDPIPVRAPPLPDGFRVRRVKDAELWRTMIRVGNTAFGGGATPDPDRLLPFIDSTAVRGYVGFVEKVPVSTSVGVSHHGIGGIFFVGTLPEYRGRGYGAAVTWQAAVDARRDGCRTSYLQASEAGYPVYLRMGYRKISHCREWLTGTLDEGGPARASSP